MNLTQIFRLLSSTYLEQRNLARLWLTWLIFGLALVGAGIPVLLIGTDGPALRFSAILFSAINCFNLVHWWMAFSLNIVRQTSPCSKQLIPGHQNAAVTAYLVAWLGTATISTAILSPMFVFMPIPLPFWVVFLIAGFALIFLTLLPVVSNWLWALPFVTMLYWGPLVGEYGKQAISRDSFGMMLAASSLALVCLLYAAIRILFLRNGDAAYKMYEKTLRMAQGMASGAWSINKASHWQAQFNGQWLYNWRLNGIGKNYVKADRSNAMQLLSYGFGNGIHWTSSILSTAWLIAYALLLLILPESMARTFISPQGIGGFSFVGFIVLITVNTGCMGALAALHQSKKEQHLLTLLPGIPARPALARAISGLMIKHVTMTMIWGGISGVIFVFILADQVTVSLMIDILRAVLISSLVLFFVLPDFSRMQSLSLRYTGMIFSGIVVAFILGIIGQILIGGLRTLGLSVGVAAMSFLFAWYRWYRAGCLPPALPVGRL
jgi:hypothetical protein